MKIAKELWTTFKKPILMIGAILIVFFLAKGVLPFIANQTANKTPIAEISAKNEKEYSKTQEIKKSDFTVKAKHESGKTSTLSNDDFELSKTSIDKTGSSTDLVITLKKNKDISCKVKVKNKRKPIVSFECGNPKLSDVKAILYSNGELCFEGKGDVLIYDEGDFPWMDYEGEDDYPIEAVTFEDTVTPTSLDYFFSKIETLRYVKNIPSSVESMENTFSETALTKAPDVSNCVNLLNMSGTYSECESLKYVPALPSTVRNIDSICEDCISLEKAPDVTNATDVISAKKSFKNCKKLIEGNVPSSVQDMSEMYSSCINLKSMPEIPNTVKIMDNAFSDDVSLTNLTNIPESVESANSCFNNCTKISGILLINGNPSDYNSFFRGAATATKVDLQGSSKMLDILASTADNDNITVNGKAPDKAISYTDLVID